jgi:hypothetical protein
LGFGRLEQLASTCGEGSLRYHLTVSEARADEEEQPPATADRQQGSGHPAWHSKKVFTAHAEKNILAFVFHNPASLKKNMSF